MATLRNLARTITNFGGNHVFRPRVLYQPASEEELLEILRQHKGSRFRAASRLHSWGAGVICDDVMIDLRRMNAVRVVETPDGATASIEGGCQVKHLLSELMRLGNWTTPSVGLITQQAIAGATATGTHGSGKNSLSHYLSAVRVAQFDPETGEPRIVRIDSGPELEAARCSLGCLGIVTGVEMPVRKQYQVEEHFARHAKLDDVLAAETEYPIQQFYFLPWRWDYYAQHRRESEKPRSALAWLYRIYCAVILDVAMHLILIPLGRWCPRAATSFFFRSVLGWFVPRGWRIVDRSDKQLTMGHHYFRHLETEIFIPRSKLGAAMNAFQWLLEHAGGEAVRCPADVQSSLEATGDWRDIDSLRGQYVHHYPICVRKVLPDATMISMASGGDEAWYAVSFITYQHPQKRQGFFKLSELMVRLAEYAFGGRPHWGKNCPLTSEQVDRLYPRIAEFRAIAKKADPDGSFTSDWTRRVLLTEGPSP